MVTWDHYESIQTLIFHSGHWEWLHSEVSLWKRGEVDIFNAPIPEEEDSDVFIEPANPEPTGSEWVVPDLETPRDISEEMGAESGSARAPESTEAPAVTTGVPLEDPSPPSRYPTRDELN